MSGFLPSACLSQLTRSRDINTSIEFIRIGSSFSSGMDTQISIDEKTEVVRIGKASGMNGFGEGSNGIYCTMVP